jgi:hypothetical protein
MVGLVPAIHDVMPAKAGHPVTTVFRDYAPLGLLDRPVKPGDDKELELIPAL